jgi:hypothetical protein
MESKRRAANLVRLLPARPCYKATELEMSRICIFPGRFVNRDQGEIVCRASPSAKFPAKKMVFSILRFESLGISRWTRDCNR